MPNTRHRDDLCHGCRPASVLFRDAGRASGIRYPCSSGVYSAANPGTAYSRVCKAPCCRFSPNDENPRRFRSLFACRAAATFIAISLCLLSLARCCVAQQELPPEILKLVRIKEKTRKLLLRLPDYTCLETIQRSRRAREKDRFRRVDTLRVDVAFIGGKELFSWPGARKFGETDVTDFISQGLISNGDFALHALSIFVNGSAQIEFAGDEILNGRLAARYDFRIPYLSSGAVLAYAYRRGRVAEHGSFWADAETFDVLRLDVYADEIPPDLPITAAHTAIHYRRVRLESAEVYIPESTELLMTESSGLQSLNSAEFSQCHQFRGESTISFADAPRNLAQLEAAAATQEIELPSNLLLELALDQPVDSETSNEGDLITAHTLGDLGVKGKVIVPKGALARGRIRRLEHHEHPESRFVVQLEFVELEFDNKRATFSGVLEGFDSLPGLSTKFPSGRSGLPGSLFGDVFAMQSVDLQGVGTLNVEGTRLRLKRGFRLAWRTVNSSRK